MKQFKCITCFWFLIVYFSCSVLNAETVDTSNPTKLFDQYRSSRYSMLWFDKHKERIQESYRKLDKIEEGFNALGRTKEVQKIREMKRQFAMIKKQMPQRGGFLQTITDMITYKDQKLKLHVKKLIKLASDIEQYDQKLQQEQINAEALAGTDVESTNIPSKTPLEIYVASLSGDIKFFVNGKEVKYAGSTFPLTPDNKFELQALVMGKQRKYAMNLKYTGNITNIDQGTHFLKYTVNLPSGRVGETHWEVTDESYNWSVSPSKSGGKWATKNGQYLNVKDDVMVLSAPGAISFNISVSGKATWKTSFKTHGKSITKHDEGSGTIKIAIAPQ